MIHELFPVVARRLSLILLVVAALACEPVGEEGNGGAGADCTGDATACTAGNVCVAQGDSSVCMAEEEADGSCHKQGFDLVSEAITSVEGAFVYTASNSESFPADLFSIELYPDRGAQIGPMSVELSGDDYASCAVCVLVRERCFDQECSTMYLAASGGLEITEISETSLHANLVGARLNQVVADGDKTVTFSGGQTRCFEDHATAFDFVPESCAGFDAEEGTCPFGLGCLPTEDGAGICVPVGIERTGGFCEFDADPPHCREGNLCSEPDSFGDSICLQICDLTAADPGCTDADTMCLPSGQPGYGLCDIPQ